MNKKSSMLRLTILLAILLIDVISSKIDYHKHDDDRPSSSSSSSSKLLRGRHRRRHDRDHYQHRRNQEILNDIDNFALGGQWIEEDDVGADVLFARKNKEKDNKKKGGGKGGDEEGGGKIRVGGGSGEENGGGIKQFHVTENVKCANPRQEKFKKYAYLREDYDDNEKEIIIESDGFRKCRCRSGCCRDFSHGYQLLCDTNDFFPYLQCLCNENTMTNQTTNEVKVVDQGNDIIDQSQGVQNKTNATVVDEIPGTDIIDQPDTEEIPDGVEESPGGDQENQDDIKENQDDIQEIEDDEQEKQDDEQGSQDDEEEIQDDEKETQENQDDGIPKNDVNTTVQGQSDGDDANDDDDGIPEYIKQNSKCETKEIALRKVIPYLVQPDERCDFQNGKEDTCFDGCCRRYNWFICDTKNNFPHLPCVCKNG